MPERESAVRERERARRERGRIRFLSVREELDFLNEHPDYFLAYYKRLSIPMTPTQRYVMYGIYLFLVVVALVLIFSQYDISLTPKP